MDADAAGGAVTGGLIAGALEKPTGKAGERRTTCSDCGAPVSANFCAECGQPTHVHRKLTHLGEELLHGVMHFDGRIWRTLPLLAFNPGRLTREWIQGRRTRYVSPLAAFLFTVFLMFFAFSFLGLGSVVKLDPVEERIAAQQETLAEARTKLAETEAEAAKAPSGEAQALTRTAVDLRRRNVVEEEARLKALLDEQAGRPAAQRADGLTAGTWQAEISDAVRSGNLKVDTGNKDLDEKLKKKLLNPDLAAYKIQQAFYKFAFLLVPLSIPAVALLFAWKRGFTWYDHGVFVLYSLTFMTLLFMGMVVADRSPDWLGAPLAIAGAAATPVHMFAQLKGTYGLKWSSAAWRTVALLFLSALVLSFFALGMVLVGLTG